MAGRIKVFYRAKYDGGGRTFGQDFIKVFEYLDLTISGHVLEWCAGPGFIGFKIKDKYNIEKLSLFDINKKLKRIIHKTVRENNLANVQVLFGSKVSDISKSKFDLIVANPPHYSKLNDYESIRVNRQRVIDLDWKTINEFLLNVSNYMNKSSLAILQMNRKGSEFGDFLHFIELGNLNLEKLVTTKDIIGLDKNMYFMVLKRK
jgi:hypothetical protein